MPAQPRVRLVIVGFSGQIGKRHTGHVLANSAAELVALVDPYPNAASIKADLEVPSTIPLFANTSALLQDDNLKFDAAIVCTPPKTHVSIATELVEAGAHVFVEKPIGDEVSSAFGLVELAKKRNVHLLVGHHRRYNPYIVAAKKALDEGLVGDVVAVSALWTALKPESYFNAGPALAWRTSRAQGGGVVLNNFVHEADCMQYLFGRIVKVHAEETIAQREFGTGPDAVEEGVVLTLRFASGAVGSYVLSDAVPSPHNFEMGTGENPIIPHVRQNGSNNEIDIYRIFGSKGSLSVPDMMLTTYEPTSDKPGWSEPLLHQKLEIDSDPRVPFERQLDHYIKVVRGEEPPNCNGAAGLNALRVCQAILSALPSGTVDL